MKKSVTAWMTVSLMAASLMGGTGAWAAENISKDGLKDSSGQIMTEVYTYAGIGDYGTVNGERLAATFRNPVGLAVLADGTLLVSDSRNHMIRSVSGAQVANKAGVLLKKDAKGLPIGGLLNGNADASLFLEPAGLSADAVGNVYVADAGNNAIRKIDTFGHVTTVAGNGLIGSKDSTGTDATFYGPQAVAVAANGTIYVADTLNHTIRSISTSGKVTTLTAPSTRVVEVTPGQVVPAGDYADGDLAKAKFNEPSGLAIDSKGNLYVSDSGNQRIRYIDLAAGKVSTVAGGAAAAQASVYEKNELYAPGDYADGEALKSLFNFPVGIALTKEGGLVIADSQNNSIRYLFGGQVTTLAGDPGLRSGEVDGIDRSAQFRKPTDVAVSADGTIYIADSYNNKVRFLDVYQLPADLPKGDDVKVALGSKAISFEVPPEIANGRTMVPVRAITEALGYKVGYNEDIRSVQLTKGDVTIELYIDKTGIKKLEKNKPEQSISTDAAPYIKDGSTYVPVRFFAEQIGLDVQWDDKTRTAILREKMFVK